MATFDYAEIIDEVSPLVEEFGTEVVFCAMPTSPDDPTKPYLGSSTYAKRQRLPALIVNSSTARGDGLGSSNKFNDLLKEEGTFVVIADMLHDLRDTCAIEIDQKEYQVQKSEHFKPAGVPLLYFFKIDY